MADKEKNEFSWTFPEFTSHERSRKWWVWFVIIDLALFLFAILSANFLYALIIIMVTGIIVFRHYHDAEDIICSINDKGMTLDDKEYRWSEIKSFWFVYEPPEVKSLYIAFKSGLKANLILPLADENPIKVREFMSQYLEEDLSQEDEPTSDALGRLLKL